MKNLARVPSLITHSAHYSRKTRLRIASVGASISPTLAPPKCTRSPTAQSACMPGGSSPMASTWSAVASTRQLTFCSLPRMVTSVMTALSVPVLLLLLSEVRKRRSPTPSGTRTRPYRPWPR